MNKILLKLVQVFIIIMTLTSLSGSANAQDNDHYLRIAKIIVDAAKLDSYKSALKEGIETAVRVEPGVLALYAVYDKSHPTHVTVFEIYASMDAYKLHIETPHFKKYKAATMPMVKSLELTDVLPIGLEAKKGL